LTARLNSAQPIAGMMYELDAIAATVIGGTSLMGGEGTLAGTLVGALIMGVLRNGLNLLGVSSFLQQIVIGSVIVVAVLLDSVLKRKHRAEGHCRIDGDRRRPLVVVQSRRAVTWHRRQTDGRAGAEDAESSVLRRHAARRAGSGGPARCDASGAGGPARDRRREADADRREPDSDPHPRARDHTERLARDRVGAGEGARRQGADHRRRYPPRPEGGGGCRRARRNRPRAGRMRGGRGVRRVEG